MANSARKSCTLIFGKTAVVLPINGAGNGGEATVSIFNAKGNRLCRASAFLDDGGTMAAIFGSQQPAGNYIVRVSAGGRESSGRFYLAR
jgi:hypothetical protein